MSDDGLPQCCDDAVASLEAVLAARSDRADEPLAAATRCVARLRDRLIARCRSNPDDAQAQERLRRVNAVLSLVVGSHYTLIGLRWQRIEAARDAIRDLMRAAS